jgi:mono/diheme cytochrome c family protein
MSFGYAIAYLVGELGWQDSDFLQFFARYNGTYSINLKDRLVLIDPLSASPWQEFFHFLTTLTPENITLARITAVNPEKQTVSVTAGQGRLVEIPYKHYADLLGQVLTDCRAYEFFQAYDRQGKGTSAGQEPRKGLASQETAAAIPAELLPTVSTSPAKADPEPTSPSALSQGRILYEQQCSACHGIEGDGKGPLAEALFPRPRNFTMGLFRYRSTPTGQLPTDQDLYRVVSRGLPGTTMPTWDQFLRREEIQETITYLKGFSKRFAKEQPTEVVTIPSVLAVTKEGLARGKRLFADMGCVSCHGEDGKGKGSASEDLKTAEGDPASTRDLTDKWSFRDGHTPEDIFRRLATGMDGSPMPSYRGMVPDEELWDLVFYILSLSPSGRPRVEDLGWKTSGGRPRVEDPGLLFERQGR